MNNILLWLRKNKNNYKLASIVIIIIVLILALLGMLWAMIAVILDFDIKKVIMNYTSYTEDEKKPELIKFIGLGMSGIIATLGVVGLLWRAASVDEQNTISKKGQVYERFNTTTKHMSNKKSVSVRIAAFNEFYHIAKIEPDLQKTIFDLLCAHLRQTTKHKDYKSNLKPTEEMQSLLDILFKPKNKKNLIFSDLEANLAEANLQGANLQDAKMQKANLQDANLQKANLQDANLQDAKMQRVNLQEADLQDAKMQKANLQDANLQDAKMQKANLQKANLQEADLQEAKMQKANLQEANLQEANLQEANLQGANLQGANLQDTKMQGANLQGANLQRQYMKEEDLQGAEINEATIVTPDNWKDFLKLHESKDGKKNQ